MSAINPFTGDPERHALWEMLVRRDIEAYLAADWAAIEADFVTTGFIGLSAYKSDNPDDWSIRFPSLDGYRDRWLEQAKLSSRAAYAEPRREALYRATSLTQISITGDMAVAHKKFDGAIARLDGEPDIINWQTLYLCTRLDGVWKISGFVGYLPNPMGTRRPH